MEPAAVAQAIIAIVGAIKSQNEGIATEKWQQEASRKLDYIVAQNGIIIAQLSRLPILIDENLTVHFNNEIVTQGVSMSRAFDQYMSGHHPDRDKIDELRQPSELLANNIIQRGPSIYQAANALAVLVLAIHKILRVDQAQTRVILDNILLSMKKWLSEEPGMFGDALKRLNSLVSEAKAALSHEPRGQGISIYSEGVVVDDGGEIPRHRYRGTIHVLADITINEESLDYSIGNVRSSEFQGSTFQDSVVSTKSMERNQKIAGEVLAIRRYQGMLSEISTHIDSLKIMVSSLELARP